MITINKIIARNYKAYKEINLSLSKYNIFIGKNSAGKSAITRLVPFIINSLALDENTPLDFTPMGIDIGATYTDIIHGHFDFKKIELGADFIVNGHEFSFLTEIMYSTEVKKLVVSKFVATTNKCSFEIVIDEEFLGEKNGIKYTYDSSYVNFKFNGLLPGSDVIDDSYGEDVIEIFSLINKIKEYNFNLSYLGPFRNELLRTYTRRTLKNNNIGIKGENSPYIFMDNEIQSDGDLGEKIKVWMKKNFSGKYFIVKSHDISFSIFCTNEKNETNIIDEGMGFAQILPSIINRHVRDIDGITGIEIIEQPELHMHPAACGSIADLYIDAIKNNIVFIETHSKELLLRVRRRVAEGLNPKFINIQYVSSNSDTGESCIETINLDEKGGVNWWPTGIFEEDFDEVMALNKAGQ